MRFLCFKMPYIQWEEVDSNLFMRVTLSMALVKEKQDFQVHLQEF